MTEKILIEAREIEDAAERAGGYVAPPWSLTANPQGEREFTAIRRYSLKTKKPVSAFTEEDYRAIGISDLRAQ